MDIKFFLLCFGFIVLANSVVFRFEPPDIKSNPIDPTFNQNPNIIRRRFRNEAPLERYQIPFCSVYDQAGRTCQKCFQGFMIQNDLCIPDPDFDPRKKDSLVDYMKKSSPVVQNQALQKIIPNTNPFCATLTPDNSLCLSCHKGYTLVDGNCIETEDDFTLAEQLYLRPMSAPKDTFCKTFDEYGNCLSCFPQATFKNGQCIINQKHEYDCRLHQFCLPESTECLTYSSEGYCKSCPKQAININGVCRINKQQSLCLELQSDGKCKRCSKFASYIDGVCKFRSPHCSQYNSDKTCNACLPTYRRVNGECIRPSLIMFLTTDANCATWRKGTCIQCKFGFGFYKNYCLKLQEIKKAGLQPEPEPLLAEK